VKEPHHINISDDEKKIFLLLDFIPSRGAILDKFSVDEFGVALLQPMSPRLVLRC
jgi:hypothetical protein